MKRLVILAVTLSLPTFTALLAHKHLTSEPANEALVAAASKAKPPAKTPTEDDYYPILRYELPPGEVLECGAIEFFPDGRLAVGTRRGEIWVAEHALESNPKNAKFTRFAHGLHEILGLAYKDGWLYVVQRCDVSRIKDSKGTGRADIFEVVNDSWEINGDYHEYAFGSRFDKEGNLWVTLCLTGSFNSSSKFRGWGGKITPDGKFVPTTSGVRSPGGVGFNAAGDVFYTDNQGPWNGPCGLKQLVNGGFVGHPDSFKWYAEAAKLNPTLSPKAPLVPTSGKKLLLELCLQDEAPLEKVKGDVAGEGNIKGHGIIAKIDADKELLTLTIADGTSKGRALELMALKGAHFVEPNGQVVKAGLRDPQFKVGAHVMFEAYSYKAGSRIMTEAKRIPELVPTCIMFPYGKMGQSASGVDCDLSNGKFGPFKEQLFVGDQTHSTVMRVFLEKVNGRYQGAVFPFRSGFGSGNVPVRFAPDGSLVTGGTNRGWGSRGNKQFALERVAWTGKVPFEIHEMRAKPDGFELTFTQKVDAATAGDLASYKMKTYTYIYRADYGSPEVDQTTPAITKVEVGADGMSARLYVGPLQPGHVHELSAAGVRSAEGLPLLHKDAYYTLNYIPK